MRLVALLPLACALLWSPAAQASPVTLIGAARARALEIADAALSVVGPLQGRFVQIGPDNQAITGSFYLQRPGKVRFAYDAPSAMAIVSNGTFVSIEDHALKTVNRAPLNSTPLGLLLKRDVDLEHDAKIIKVARDGDAILVTLRERRRDSNGELTLTFDEPARELRQWQVRDASGNITVTALQTMQNVAVLNPKLFVPMEPPPPPRSRP
jgi:outer membrane lipoprotein-sorting protein